MERDSLKKHPTQRQRIINISIVVCLIILF